MVSHPTKLRIPGWGCTSPSRILFYHIEPHGGPFAGVIIIHMLNSMMFMTWIPSGAFWARTGSRRICQGDAGAAYPFRHFSGSRFRWPCRSIAVASVFTFLGSLEEAQGTLVVGFPPGSSILLELYGVIMEYPLTGTKVRSLILILPTVYFES